MPRIVKLASDLQLLNEFQSAVHGFSDSLIIAKNLLKDRQKEKKKFSIEALASDFLDKENVQKLHNAVNDVQVLQKLLEKIGITDEIVKTNSKKINQISQDETNKNEIKMNKLSLNNFIPNISKGIISKMAKVGINNKILQETFAKSGETGIRILLGENVNGKARVTNNDSILKKIMQLIT